MKLDQPSPSRLDAVAVLFAELERGPVNWPSLLKLTQRIAPMVRALRGDPIHIAAEERERVADFAPPPATPEETASSLALRRVLTFILDICAYGPAEALARCFDDVPTMDAAPAFLSTLNLFIVDGGLPRDLTPAELIALDTHRLKVGDRIDLLLDCLNVLGLSKDADHATRRAVFLHVAAPRIRAAATAGKVDVMLSIEAFLYGRYLKLRETREHHFETLQTLEEAASHLPYADAFAEPRSAVASPPRIVFLIPNGNILAHTELLLSFLTGLAQVDAPIIEPIVLIYADPKGGKLGGKLDQMGVKWFGLGLSTPYAYDSLFGKVRSLLADIAADAVVFVSTPIFIPYFCRRPLAPRQIWWPMKFMLPLFDGLDGRVSLFTMFDSTQVIEGRTWLGGPISMPPPPAANPDSVAAIRMRFPNMKILGTIGREEKIADIEFLNAVTEILRRNPDTCFLWTGRNRLPEIDSVFHKAGVADRCHFVGWIDPSPYLVAFDLVIETPLTGLMFGWAMALGTPVISIGSRGWLGVYLASIFDGSAPIGDEDRARIDAIFEPIKARLPGIWAADAAEAVQFADLLLNDAELRDVLGAAQKSYVNSFMVGEAESAAIQARHFATIARSAPALRPV